MKSFVFEGKEFAIYTVTVEDSDIRTGMDKFELTN